MLILIGAIAAGIVAGLVVFNALKLTLKAFIGIVHKFRVKGAKKTLVADINALIEQCPNRKSLSALEELQDEGYTQVAAGVDENGALVDDVQLIHDENEETAYEIIELLGDEGMVVIED